jgi:hypothetical protein
LVLPLDPSSPENQRSRGSEKWRIQMRNDLTALGRRRVGTDRDPARADPQVGVGVGPRSTGSSTSTPSSSVWSSAASSRRHTASPGRDTELVEQVARHAVPNGVDLRVLHGGAAGGLDADRGVGARLSYATRPTA